MTKPSENAALPIEIHDLTRRFGQKVALNKISISVPRGCVFGLLGENGAGKTTLIKHLLGLLKPQSGSVAVCGYDPVKHPEQALGKMGYLSEDRDIPNWMSIQELMRYSQGLYPNWDQQFADELCKKFELNPAQKIRTLSKGETAKAGLISALAHRPELLVLDEPSSGLDVVVRRDILDTMMRAVADEGRTILFSSHLMDEVESISDYVAILHRGDLMCSGPLSEVKGEYHQVHVRFPESHKVMPHVDGALRSQGSETDWTLLCDGNLEKIRASLTAINATIVSESPASLEDVFVNIIGTPTDDASQ